MSEIKPFPRGKSPLEIKFHKIVKKNCTIHRISLKSDGKPESFKISLEFYWTFRKFQLSSETSNEYSDLERKKPPFNGLSVNQREIGSNLPFSVAIVHYLVVIRSTAILLPKNNFLHGQSNHRKRRLKKYLPDCVTHKKTWVKNLAPDI